HSRATAGLPIAMSPRGRERAHWIDTRCAQRREPCGTRRNEEEDRSSNCVRDGIPYAYLEEHRAEHARSPEGGNGSEGDASYCQCHRLTHDETHHARGRRSQRNSHADLLRPLSDEECDHAV